MGDSPSRKLPALLRFLAVGRLSKNETGEFLERDHKLIAHNLVDLDGGSAAAAIKQQIKTIMKKAAHKLQIGKRIRLQSDDNDYDLYILTDKVDGDPYHLLIFVGLLDLSSLYLFRTEISFVVDCSCYRCGFQQNALDLNADEGFAPRLFGS